MITNEQAYNSLVAMSRRWADDYSNSSSWVANTSKFAQSYPGQHCEFKLDSTLSTITGPKQFNTTVIATDKSH